MLDRLGRHAVWQVLLVALVAAAVYLPFLGVRPLDFSEGHRAIPGWEMLERGDGWHQTMFGLTYVRKPPGMAWAIAAASWWLGETTFAARLPSAVGAIAMSVLAWWYGRRWLGRVSPLAGVSAGLAQALMPFMWSPGRSAEVEMLCTLGTQMLGLGLLDTMLFTRRERENADEPSPLRVVAGMAGAARDVLIPALGLLAAALAKGWAGSPVLVGVLIGACVAVRSARPLRARGVWVALLLGGSALGVLLLKFAIANDRPDAVRENAAGEFLWAWARVPGILTLPAAALATAMPAGLALLVTLPGLRGGRTDDEWRSEWTLARGLAWGWVASITVFVLAGVSNPRYAMPAAGLLPPLVPIAMLLLQRSVGAANDRLRRGPRRLWLDRPWVWACVMGMGAWWYVGLTSLAPTNDQRASVAAAQTLTSMSSFGEVWADDAIEARPDVPWLMQERAPLRVRWRKRELRAGELPPPGGYLLLRTDHGSAEGERYEAVSRSTTLVRLGVATVRRYEFTLYQVRAGTGPLPP